MSKHDDAKVLVEAMLNPEGDVRSVAADCGISSKQVREVRKRLPELVEKSAFVQVMAMSDAQVMLHITEQKLDMLEAGKVDATNLNAWEKQAMTRYMLLVGNLTNEDGGLDIKAASDEQLLSIIRNGA